jgi:hypothetical protein
VIPIPPITQSSDIVYYIGIDTVIGFKDVAWITIKKITTRLAGIENLPAETDSKVGLLSGMIIESDTLMVSKKQMLSGYIRRRHEHKRRIDF